MKRSLLAILFLLVLFAVMALSPRTTIDDDVSPVALRITPESQFEPGRVTYRIYILPHRDNFWFCMGWHNTTTFKSRTSCEQLNGMYAPRVFYQEYTALTGGFYFGFADVYRVPNRRAATTTQQFRVETRRE